MSVVADRGALAFAEKLLQLLGEGRFTATYKYAVILGLMELCLEYSTGSGAAPTMVTTRQLAEKVTQLYWRHSLPFRGDDVLQQNRGRQARILAEIADLRSGHAPGAGVSLLRARQAAPDDFERMLTEVEWTLVEMPLPKLQRIGDEAFEFIYVVGWSDRVRRGEFNSANFDNRIQFIRGAGDHLVRLAGLIRPLVQREWTDHVAHLNRGLVDESELADFLFGAGRIALGPVRGPLRELQHGSCFYCHSLVRDVGEVDHFIPWSRYPTDGIENLVFAHGQCNNAKRDHLAAGAHVEKWADRAKSSASDLGRIADEQAWGCERTRSLSVARSIYLRLPDDARLWQSQGEFVAMDRAAIKAALGG